MPITRIAFNDSASYSGAYYVILNPSRLELNESDASVNVNILDGAPVKQEPYLDSRPIVMQWTKIHNDYAGFVTMLEVLKTYVNTNKYVNYGTADYRVSATSWNYVRVTDVKAGIEPGGKLKYNVEVVLSKDIE